MSVRSYVINNIVKLEGFITEFKNNHQDLIKIAEENRIVKAWIKKDDLKIALTAKERLIGQYYSRGMSASNIAHEMGLTEKTIYNNLESIKDKYLLFDGKRDKETLIKKLRTDYTLFHG